MFQVIVGNIGTIYDGESKIDALLIYLRYRAGSINNYGHAEALALLKTDIEEQKIAANLKGV